MRPSYLRCISSGDTRVSLYFQCTALLRHPVKSAKWRILQILSFKSWNVSFRMTKAEGAIGPSLSPCTVINPILLTYSLTTKADCAGILCTLPRLSHLMIPSWKQDRLSLNKNNMPCSIRPLAWQDFLPPPPQDHHLASRLLTDQTEIRNDFVWPVWLSVCTFHLVSPCLGIWPDGTMLYTTLVKGWEKHTCQVTLDISWSPTESQWCSRKYPG